jgi:hypothetical protein
MADIVSSLFGLSPREQYARDRQQEFEMQARTMSGMYDNQYDRQNAYLGSKLGSLIGQGVGNLFGLQDPALKRMSGLEGVLQEAQQELGQDMADPTKLYPTLADKLQQRGFGREAAMVTMQGQQAINDWQFQRAKLENENAQSEKFKAEAIRAAREDNPQMKIFNELAKNSSPKAVAQAIANGYDIAMLDSPEKTKMSSKAQELVDAGFAYGTPEFNAKMNSYINSEMSGKAKGTGNVTIGSIDVGKMADASGKKIGDKLADIPLQLKAKEALQGGLTQLDQGINSGIYANIKQGLTKATGGAIGSSQKVENTEVYKSYIGNVVIPMMAQLGGSDSNEELRKMEAIVAGDVTLEAGSMRRILKNAQAAIDRDIARTKGQEGAAIAGERAPVDNLAPLQPVKRYNRATGKMEMVK